MLSDAMGPAQVAAIAVLFQRALEECYSQYNTQQLLKHGAHEEGRSYYPTVAVTHLCWIASLALLVPVDAPLLIIPLLGFSALQILRYWIIGVLGRYWTHRIISLPGAPIVAHGPYRFLRHPNYIVSIAETFLLPLVFGQLALSILFTLVWTGVLHYKIQLEDAALVPRRAAAYL